MKPFEEIDKHVELAYLLQAIAHFGWDEIIYTHASIRLDKHRYVTNNFGLLFREHTPQHALEVDMRKGPQDGQNVAGYHIHRAIYKARPDVECVIHTHTPAGIAVSSNKEGLWAASQPAMLAAGSLSRHEYQGVVDTKETSKKLVEDLGSTYFMLMSNHGLLTVGNRPSVTFHRMYRLQQACEIQVMMCRDHTQMIDENVILDQVTQSRDCDYERPGTELFWEAMKRKIGIKW